MADGAFLDGPRITSWFVSDHFVIRGGRRWGPAIARTVSVTVEVVVPADEQRHPEEMLSEMLGAWAARKRR